MYRNALREVACNEHCFRISMSALKSEITINFRIRFNGYVVASKYKNLPLMQGQKLKFYELNLKFLNFLNNSFDF